MKKYFILSAAALALASCSNDEFLGNDPSPNTKETGATIAFGSEALNATRADFTGSQAAEKLGGNFIVYGFKTMSAETTTSEDLPVFDLYNVNYEAGTANTTESNTANWEYVGLANHTGAINPQTIKYWDYSAAGYVFSAVSGTGISATKTTTGGFASIYDKGWTISIPAGGSISDLYASDRKPIAKADYQRQVDLTFRALGTKIRFAMYETIPGYSVKINNLYYDNLATANPTNFAIDGTFVTTSETNPTTLTVTYNDGTNNTVENTPKVTYTTTGTGAAVSASYMFFGANIQATGKLGTTSVEATYDQADKSYTMILPVSTGNDMKLMVDYTLTATDKETGAETIEVKHATAIVPANFNQWKPNFAYTYIFKISDNTNGSTGTPGTDPAGLYPITFDAIVITDDQDVQETITSVSNPSITTYQQGAVVTENDEYKAGFVYFEDGGKDVSTYGVYEVNNYGTIENITEEVVANWKNNFCVLTPVWAMIAPGDGGTGAADFIPLSDGTYIQKKAGEAGVFQAEAGKTYVIANADATVATQYKVVKVTGSIATPVTYTVGSDATISTVEGTATINVQQASAPVLGVTPNFTINGSVNNNKGLRIVEAGNGNYTVSVDPAAIAAGKANDVYKVSFDGNDVNITVDIAYVLRNAADDADVTAVTIVAGNTTGATVINKIAGTAADGDVTEVPEGITIEKTATGTYKVTADKNVAYKAAGYTAKIAGQTLTINVDSYAFTGNLVITKALTGSSTGTLTLQKNGVAASGTHALTGTDDAIATNSETDGVYTFTAVAGGSFEVTYENAKATVTVNEYSMTATPVAPATDIKKSTGVANIEVKCNGETINAATASLAETAKPTDAVYTVTTNGKLIKFSNASKAGDYKFDYKVGTTVVAQVTVTVTE